MRSSINRLALLFGMSAMLGCGITSGFVPLAPPPHFVGERPASDVELFTAGPPRRAYQEVGIVEVSGYGDSPPTELLAELRAVAGAHGCNAVVVTGSSARLQTSYRGTCVVYTLEEDSP